MAGTIQVRLPQQHTHTVKALFLFNTDGLATLFLSFFLYSLPKKTKMAADTSNNNKLEENTQEVVVVVIAKPDVMMITTTTKKPRPLDELKREHADLSKRYYAICKEIDNHPVEKQVRKQARMQRLATHFPPLMFEKMLELGFRDYSMCASLDVASDDESVVHLWEFSASFGNDQFTDDFTCDLYVNGQDNDWEFESVDFDQRSTVLWRDALIANSYNPAEALAAFCWACCEHLGDYNAVPSKAFPGMPRAKKEVV